jgi:hypothetical protein
VREKGRERKGERERERKGEREREYEEESGIKRIVKRWTHSECICGALIQTRLQSHGFEKGDDLISS